MRFAGRIVQAGKYWAVEAPILDVITQGARAMSGAKATPPCRCSSAFLKAVAPEKEYVIVEKEKQKEPSKAVTGHPI